MDLISLTKFKKKSVNFVLILVQYLENLRIFVTFSRDEKAIPDGLWVNLNGVFMALLSSRNYVQRGVKGLRLVIKLQIYRFISYGFC